MASFSPVAVKVSAEHGVEGTADEDGGPGVATVVEELAQRRARASPPRLFSIDAVQRVRQEEEKRDEEPDEARDGVVVRLGQTVGVVIVVVEGG